jgi:hypothetical protein
MDWDKAKEYFDKIRKQHQDMEGVPGVNTSIALRVTFDPLSRRYNSGERTGELYGEMMSVIYRRKRTIRHGKNLQK